MPARKENGYVWGGYMHPECNYRLALSTPQDNAVHFYLGQLVKMAKEQGLVPEYPSDLGTHTTREFWIDFDGIKFTGRYNDGYTCDYRVYVDVRREDFPSKAAMMRWYRQLKQHLNEMELKGAEK